MNRYKIIKDSRYKMQRLNAKLKNIKNYKNLYQMMKDVTRWENCQKEIEIQECYIKIGK